MVAMEVIRKTVQDCGLWRVDQEEGFNLLRGMFGGLSGVYSITTPTLIEASYEHYLVPAQRIGLPRASLVSALHEYRHHMQKFNLGHYPDIEVDARAWSISAFYTALPTAFDKAWKEGRIWYLPPYGG
ncbi:hypothetical protein ES703_71306 [subsurface metagenome]